jgi:hypothetical protein
MKKKVNYILQLVACVLFFSMSKITAQTTGVLTRNPSNPLHIDAAKDNTTPTASEILNDVVVTPAGNLGIGLLNPITKVDLRSGDPKKGIIGVGTNTQTAAAAGGGALRYNTGGFLEYSDGEQWIALPLAPPAKVLINASNASGQSIPIGTTASTTITGWTTTVDAGNNFNQSTGIFTAPRDGFYLVSFSITLANGNIPKNTYLETAIESSQSTNNIPIFKTVNSYPAFQAGSVSNYLSGNCNAIFNLKANDTVKFTVKYNNGTSASGTTGTRSVLNDAKLNNISISEL